MEPEVYVFNSPGCHGHYLTYLLDKFSKKTPEITSLPFNSLGNSHIDIKYSNFIKFVDSTDHSKYSDLKNKKIIKIIYNKDILYYERVAMNRASDTNRDINNIHKDISFLQTYNNEFYNKIYKIYNITNDTVPKWLLRDAYKLGFLDLKNQGSVVSANQSIHWIENTLKKTNNVHYLDVSAFFTTNSLAKELQTIDNLYNLTLDLQSLQEIHKEFIKRNKILHTSKNTEITLNAISNKKNIEIPTLDIIQQAFVYAELEKNYDFISMPLVDDFFKTSADIINYLNLYPKHYQAMNPNLPTFNNIPNPYFLHRQKTK